MTKVHECTLDDVPFLMEKVHQFNADYYDVPLNTKKARDHLVDVLVSEQGLVLRTSSGMIAGVFVSDPLRDWNVLVETAWYSEGRDGIKLLAEFERRAALAGVDEVRMTTLSVNSGVDAVLKRRGYSSMETSHRLIL